MKEIFTERILMCQQVFHMMFPTQIIKKFHLGGAVRVKASLDWWKCDWEKKEDQKKKKDYI